MAPAAGRTAMRRVRQQRALPAKFRRRRLTWAPPLLVEFGIEGRGAARLNDRDILAVLPAALPAKSQRMAPAAGRTAIG